MKNGGLLSFRNALLNRVELQPNKHAIVAGKQEATYLQAWRLAKALANRLCDRGVGPGGRIGIALGRSLNLPLALLAVLEQQAAYVPLDLTWPPARLLQAAHDSQVSLVLTDSDDAAKLFPEWQVSYLTRDHEPSEALHAISADQCEDASALAYIIYTSGSTGVPKGVAVSREALGRRLRSLAALLSITPEDRWFALTALSFDIATLELLLPLTVGAELLVATSEECETPSRLASALRTSQATVLQCTPSMWRLLLDHDAIPPTLRLGLCGGDVLPRKLANDLCAIGCQVWNLYGPTEATIWATAHQLTDVHYNSDPAIGTPLADTTTHVLDTDLRQVNDIGHPGELYLGGDCLAEGYLGDSALTARHFVADPFDPTPGSRLYRTGDLVRHLPDGNLAFVGRVDHQMKIRGYRVEPGEVEAQIRAIPEIDDVVVVSRDSPDGTKVLVAYVVARTSELVVKDIRTQLRTHLPGYMVPSIFVTLQALPLTRNGKVDRAALPRVTLNSSTSTDPGEAPTPTERIVAAMWERALELNTVGVHDDFFLVGGHSLTALQMILCIWERFNVELTMDQILERSTVSGVASLIDEALQRAKGVSS